MDVCQLFSQHIGHDGVLLIGTGGRHFCGNGGYSGNVA